MKTIVMALAMLLAVSATTFAQAKQKTTQRSQKTRVSTKYTCEMDPEVVRSKPGKCPKCGMKLVAIKGKKPPAGKTGTKM